jgi:hypothetical protein
MTTPTSERIKCTLCHVRSVAQDRHVRVMLLVLVGCGGRADDERADRGRAGHQNTDRLENRVKSVDCMPGSPGDRQRFARHDLFGG